MTDSERPSASPRIGGAAVVPLVLLAMAVVVAPLGIPAINRLSEGSDLNISYLPSFERIDNACIALQSLGIAVAPPTLEILLPAGISFYTFQALSYTIDIYRGEMLWAGVFAFGIQIYADFSAYSDIARGIARWFGFQLLVNFNHPYIAHSPTDLWRRWHISLSTWFRDYVYIPLGGRRVSSARAAINVLITFLLSGLWHGASWNFVLWGLYHGTLLLVSRSLGSVLRLPERWRGPLALPQIAMTFVLMMAGGLLFRETNATYLLRHLTLSPFASSPEEREIGVYLFMTAAIWAIPLLIDDLMALWRERTPYWRPLRAWRRIPRLATEMATVGGLFAMILVLRSPISFNFIYFQF